MRTTIPIAFGLLMFTGEPSYSANWVEFFVAPTATGYIDTDNIMRSDGVVRAWFKLVAKEPLEIPTDEAVERHREAVTFDYSVTLNYIQCEERRIASVRADYFDAKGTLLANRLGTAEAAIYYDIPPDSLGDRLHRKLCI